MNRMRILIAYDPSGPSQAMLDDLRHAGLPEHAEVLAMSFVEAWLPEPVDPPDPAENEGEWMRSLSLTEFEEAEEHSAEVHDRIRAMFPGWSVSAITHADQPTRGILEKEGEWGPDLIVVGTHDRSMVGRVMAGSVSQELLARAQCSVRVARAPFVPSLGGVRIVLGFDGSPESLAAAEAVAARTWPAGSVVCVISAYDQGMLATNGFNTSEGDDPVITFGEITVRQIENRAKEIVSKLTRTGLAATSIVSKGNPASIILDVAERWGADSIFLGARGHGILDRMLLGSISNAVVKRARCSVEVVRITNPQ